MRIYLLISCLAVALTAGIFLYHNHTIKSSLTFSNTQTWDADLYALSMLRPLVVPDVYEKIYIQKPPTNTSQTTRHELRTLLQLVNARSPEKIAEIQNEVDLDTVLFGDKTYKEVTNVTIRPHTSNLITTALSEFSIIVLYYKNMFDRVRPHVLESELTTAIEVPSHPAYPSGHASQSYFIALVLADIDPRNRDAYIESAYRVAHNREIAGVHYPSDSDAGRDLAQQYFDLLSETMWYKLSSERSREEWR